VSVHLAQRARMIADFYRKAIAVSASKGFQYRANNYLLMVTRVVEAMLYLGLWQAVATANGGSVGGWTVHQIAAYFVVWTLVRNMNIAFSPLGFEERIRRGRFSQLLLQPIHPIHYDIAEFAGKKLVMIVIWFPVAVLMTVLFDPAVNLTVPKVLVFVLALLGAFLLRSLYLWLLGLITFWTTRASALFDLVVGAELLFSGRFVPVSFLPGDVHAVGAFLPFQWTFSFPIEALVANDRTAGQLVSGLAAQALWIVGCGLCVAVAWRLAVRRYTAVGN
jgi:ABC-2 type transport system permease protein